MKEFRIRRATADDRASVVGLVSEMFGADVSVRYDWLYRANPHGEALTWLAFPVDEPERAVGVTSVFPRRVVVRGRERVGSIGGDCYVAPVARRRGLATRLHTACFSDMSSAGVDFMYGPPLPNNLKALLKAGSTEVGVFRRFSRPLTGHAAVRAVTHRPPGPLLSRAASIPMRGLARALRADLCGIEARVVEQFGGEFEELWRSVHWPAAVCPVRDPAFLNWRYIRAPSCRQVPLAIYRRGVLSGFVAFEVEGDEAVVVDLVCADRDVTDAALQLAVDRASEAGCSHIDFYQTPSGPHPRHLTRRGFFPREDRVFQVAVAEGDPQRETLVDPGSWYFTEGDKDMPSCFSDAPT